MSRIIICGNTCGHDHEGVNSPTGCCEEHGPYFYYCYRCSVAADRPATNGDAS